MRFTATTDGITVRAPAKLNLYLEVDLLRDDGFHPIDSIFQAISLYDTINFRRRDDDAIRFPEDPLGVGEQNLVYRAATLLREHLGSDAGCGVDICLQKGIPHGGGLGGGSSDAAATLLALDRLWGARAPREQLEEIGLALGSDVPFFFHGGTARCQGRGEIVTPFHDVFDREAFHYVVVCPGIHVSTPAVYRELDRLREVPGELTPSSGLDGVTSPSALEGLSGGELFFNRLQEVACGLVSRGGGPDLGLVAARMENESFRAVQMSGSGSTFFGLCGNGDEAAVSAEGLRRALGADLGSDLRVFEATSLPGWSGPHAR